MARAKKEKVKKVKKEKGEKKKGGKKKLLIPLLALVVLAAAAVVVWRFVLPKLGGGEDDTKPPKKGIETYTIGEDSAAALDTILEEDEGRLVSKRGPEKPKEGETPEERYTYIYELEGYADIMNRYLDLMTGSEQGFSLVDEEYLILEERPELADAEGALILARASVQEGHIFQLVIGWSQTSGTLAVRASAPEGALHHPAQGGNNPPPIISATIEEQLETLKSMTPAQLTLPGSSMSEYDIYPMEGFVQIDDYYCRRFNIYEAGQSNEIAAIIFLSGDQSHVFRMDVNDNSIITRLQ